MALLAEAIRASDAQTALYRSPAGYTVTVNRVTGRAEPYIQEAYDVLVERVGAPATDRFNALDLLEVFERLRGLGLPEFDPEGTGWEVAPSPHPAPSASPPSRDELTAP